MKQIDQLWILSIEAGYKIGLIAETQEDLGKTTFATFPRVGQTLVKGDSLIELEAEKAVSEFSSPLSGKVAAIDEAADQEPGALDEENAWITVSADVEPTESGNLQSYVDKANIYYYNFLNLAKRKFWKEEYMLGTLEESLVCWEWVTDLRWKAVFEQSK